MPAVQAVCEQPRSIASTGLVTVGHNSQPLAASRGTDTAPTVAVLRRKLDAAIVAEAWEAVKAIRERIAEVEREAAGNVVAVEFRRRR